MKKILRKIYHTSRSIYIHTNPKYKKHLKVHWLKKRNNFGDILNPILINLLTQQNSKDISSEYYFYKNYLLIGSILQYANKNSIVWGSGFISHENKLLEEPLSICAVRGKLTREKLLKQGINCPEIYGDPALLMPFVYKPKVEKKYKLGIIPHYVDKNNFWLNSLKNRDDILIIDIITDSPLETIKEILSCENIASSSLHGLIIADAYKIPSVWIEFSNKVYGAHFKFHDYFSSIEKNISLPYKINKDTLVNVLIEKAEYSILNIDLDALLNSCPFNKKLNNKV